MQYDVHRNPDRASNALIPYFLDVQAETFERFVTRVVIPLMEETVFGPRIRQLNPVFVIEGRELVLATADIASIHRSELGECVASLAEHRYDIINATDFLFTGV